MPEVITVEVNLRVVTSRYLTREQVRNLRLRVRIKCTRRNCPYTMHHHKPENAPSTTYPNHNSLLLPSFAFRLFIYDSLLHSLPLSLQHPRSPLSRYNPTPKAMRLRIRPNLILDLRQELFSFLIKRSLDSTTPGQHGNHHDQALLCEIVPRTRAPPVPEGRVVLAVGVDG